jgi:hypothetical protein
MSLPGTPRKLSRWQRVKNWWNGVPEQLEEDQKNKWYVTIDRSYTVAVRKKEFDDYVTYVTNAYNPAEFRMFALIKLVAACATSAGPRDDANLAEMLGIWNQLIGLFWYPMVLVKKHREEELLGIRQAVERVNMPLEQLETVMSYVADKRFIHRGLTLAELTWGEADHVPQFTNVREQMPLIQPQRNTNSPGAPST